MVTPSGEKWETKVERLANEIVYSIADPEPHFNLESGWKLKHKTKVPAISNYRPGKFSAIFESERAIQGNSQISIGTVVLNKDGKTVSSLLEIQGKVINSEAATRTMQLVTRDVIRELENSELWFGTNEKQQISDLAISQSLTSKYTSFFAEEERTQVHNFLHITYPGYH